MADYSPADYAAITNAGNGMDGWGGMIWLFAILALFGGGGHAKAAGCTIKAPLAKAKRGA